MAGRILIADDVATNRLTLGVQLRNARYEVSTVETSSELLRCLRRVAPDLLVLSDRFADEDGVDLCRRIRADRRTREIPVLMLLQDPAMEARIKPLEAGADEILSKPYTEFALMARVRALLRARETRAETVRRQQTAATFGFAEAQAEFCDPTRVTLVPADPSTGDRWLADLPGLVGAKVSIKSPNMALDDADGSGSADAFVVDSDISRPGGGMALLSDLRSRPGARHAAILFAHPVDDTDTGATALDLGANDLVPLTASPAEIALRLRTQIRRKREADALRKTVEDGLRLAATDPLTGLFNRRYAMAYLDRAASESRRTGKPFAVMVADLDHFKRINDEFGHSAGDDVLRRVAHAMRDCLRGEDLVARLGGEEFLVVMPATDLDRARPAAERLCRIVADMPMAIPGGHDPIFVTMSVGGAVGGASADGSDVETLVARADAALYRAKADGRNKVDISLTAA